MKTLILTDTEFEIVKRAIQLGKARAVHVCEDNPIYDLLCAADSLKDRMPKDHQHKLEEMKQRYQESVDRIAGEFESIEKKILFADNQTDN